MKKTLFVMVIIVLACILSAGIASAEYGYTRVSDIPMAVDFTYSGGIAEDGTPYLQTDYPFEETGAMQMILMYITRATPVIDITYDPATKQASFSRFEEGLFRGMDLDHEQMLREAARMIRDGELEPFYIFIGTVHGGPETDWWLEYIIPRQEYVSYEERTFCPSFYDSVYSEALSTIYYKDGVINKSYIRKKLNPENYNELNLYYDAYGKLVSQTHVMHTPYGMPFYDPETGLFDGKRIDELDDRFTEADLQIPAPAALDPVE